jgi:hypothetical protein
MLFFAYHFHKTFLLDVITNTIDYIIMNMDFERSQKGSKITISSAREHFCDDKRRSLKQDILKKK